MHQPFSRSFIVRSLCFFIISFCISNFTSAQKPRIYIPDHIFTDLHTTTNIVYDYSSDKVSDLYIFDTAIYDQIAKKIPASQLSYVLRYCTAENRPAAYKTVDNYEIEKAKMYFLCSFTYKDQDFVIVELPAAENQQLPPQLRPASDIYFIAGEYFMYDSYNVGGKKQYSNSIMKSREKQENYFMSFLKDADTRGMIDSTLYFKTTVPAPAVTRNDALAYFNAHLGALAIDKQTQDMYDQVERNKQQAIIQKKKDSLTVVINSTVELFKIANQPWLDMYNQGKASDILVNAGMWRTIIIRSDATKPRAAGDIRGPANLYFSETNHLRFFKDYTKGGLNIIGEVGIFVRDEDPSDMLWESRNLSENFNQHVVPGGGDPNLFISDEKHGTLFWDLSNTPLSGFIPKITEYKDEAMADQFTMQTLGSLQLVVITMKTKHYDNMMFAPDNTFDLYEQIAQLKKIRDNL